MNACGIADFAPSQLRQVQAISLNTLPRDLQCTAGSICHVEGPQPDVGCPWARICFAAVTQDQVKTGVQRLAKVLRKYQAAQQTR